MQDALKDTFDDTSQNAAATPGQDLRSRIRRQIDDLKPRPKHDRYIWGIYLALVFISVIELFSASSREITGGDILGPVMRHAALLFMGFLLMLGLQRTHYVHFYRWAYVIGLACVGATIYTMFFGLYINGARRAFSFFGLFTVQPSELLKFAAALVIARILSRYIVKYTPGNIEEEKRYNRTLVTWVAVIVGFACALLYPQGLTNTFLLFVISLSVMVIGGVRWREWLAVCTILAVVGAAGYGLKKAGLFELFSPAKEKTEDTRTVNRDATRENRITQYLRTDKYNDPITSQNAQEQYSYIAQANGGIYGKFPGNSRETARLPLAFSDYIYAIIIEDTGLIGGTVLLVLYLLLLARAGRIAMKCRHAFPALLVIGMAVFIVCQALMHMGIVTGFLPVSGQPLPLISKGGSSVIITSIALGMMLSVSRFAQRKGQRQEANEKIIALDQYQARENPSQL